MRFLLASALLALVFASGCGAVSAGKDLADQGNAFMTALKEGDFQAAYDQMTPELQQEIGSVDALQSMIVDNAATPSEWKFSGVNMSTEEGMNTGTLDGSVDYTDGKSGTVNLEYVQQDQAWKMLSFSLNW
jgi:hypothetical protein